MAEGKQSADQFDSGDHPSAVDPVGSYLIKRRQEELGDNYYRPPYNRRMADPVGSYLLRRRVDPVGSYLIKKSSD